MADISLPAERLPRGSNKGQKAICHPDRAAHCKRLCQGCYIKARQQVRITRARCHPERPHYALGFCRNCHRYHQLREKPAEYRSAKNRRAALKYKFGLTVEQVATMLAAQGGVCAICGGGFDGHRWKKPCVDHCHATGKIRGLLCFKCNSGLGYYEKYAAQYEAYVRQHRESERVS